MENLFEYWIVPTTTSGEKSEFWHKLHGTVFALSNGQKLLHYFFSLWWVVDNLLKDFDEAVMWCDCLPSLKLDLSGPGKCFVS